MIKSLLIRNVASYNNEGITMNDLSPINIIYGSNGTGKSTIGKVIANIDSYSRSSISWKDNRPIEILVYNKDFCKKNFQEQMPGVFTLGEAGTAAKAEIEAKRAECEKIYSNKQGYESELKKQTESLNAENKSFCESAWIDVFKKHEHWASKTAIGVGTKDKFITKLMLAYHQNHSKPLSIEMLKKKAAVLFAQQPPRMEPYTLIDNQGLSSIEIDSLWAKIIVGKQDIDIAGLISKLDNSDWVRQGVEYMEGGSDVCPFCQQHTITQKFRSRINEFFDETYKQDIQKVSAGYEVYKKAVNDLVCSLNGCVELQKEQEKSLVDSVNLGSSLSTLKATFDKNIALISLKKKEPSRVIALTKTADMINAFNDKLAKANISISEHNKLVDNSESEKSILIKEIWKFFAAEYDAAIAKHLHVIKDINSDIKNLERKRDETAERCNEISGEIAKLENSVTSITPTINEINQLLKGYGFTNLQIQEAKDNKNYYQIVRENGEPAKNTLSEGETTFITFLYYMQLIKGSFQSDGITKDRVLVIDDPVSSLDSNVLFIVSSLLREVFKNMHEGKGSVKQVMILTHNVYFHKEITFSDRNCKWKGDVKYWILRKRDNQTSIQDYDKQNPIKSSYELMWTELKSKSQHSCIVVQNIMRRIIEYYFNILGGVKPNEILERFDNHEERIICQSLLSWVNGGSHSLPDDLFVEMSEEKLDINMNVFKEIFHKMGQDAHYEMMMQMCDKEDERHCKTNNMK